MSRGARLALVLSCAGCSARPDPQTALRAASNTAAVLLADATSAHLAAVERDARAGMALCDGDVACRETAVDAAFRRAQARSQAIESLVTAQRALADSLALVEVLCRDGDGEACQTAISRARALLPQVVSRTQQLAQETQ